MIPRLALAVPLALAAGAAATGAASAQGLLRAAPAPPLAPPSTTPEPSAKREWNITLFQIDKANTLVGSPVAFACGPLSCETPVKLDVAGKPAAFLVVVTLVPHGAYFALQPQQQDGITKAVEFEKTYLGPIFLQIRGKTRFTTTLRFTLAGPAMRDSEERSASMMDNQRSRVFQRKVEPDLILRVALERDAF